jgi:hypothetical protein
VTSHSSTFQSDGTVGTFTVTALSGSVSGTAQVTVQDTQAPTLSISAPVNGATVYQTVTVSGTASDNVGVTQVEVRVDSGTWNIATGTTSWQWDLDTTGLSDGAHTINVRALDAAGNATTDSVSVTVDNAPALTLLSPLGGESWAAGSTQIIRFDSHLFSDVTIRYSLNAGGNWTDIEGSWAAAEGENAYTWTVPNATTDHARVLVQAYSGESPVQSADFSITGGTQWLTLTAPVGGETLSGNDLATVTWDCGGVDTVRLMLSLDGGRTWSDVATVRDSQLEWQNYAWSVPNVASDFCILRVSDLSGNVSSQSSPFAIEPVTGTPGAVEVTNVRLNWSIPTEATDLTSVTVGGTNCPVVDGRVQCDIAVPADVRTMMVEIAGTDGAGVAFSRLIRIDVADRAPPIDGLNVSKQELVSFLDGREGVLVWVDINAGRRIKVLDFRAADPVVRVLNDHTSCVNPIVSPDGTRVVYSVGNANGTKSIYVARLSDGARQLIATGDVGYWQFDAGNEYIVYCDWSSSANNGTDGKTWRRRLTAGTITPDGTAVEIHSRAMDAGVTGDGQWLGHVYSELYVWDLVAGVEYGPGDFFLLEGDVATSQTCNGSMSPSGTAAIMELVIPHEWVRVFTYESSGDVFRESTRLQLPAGMVEWEFPEWSTDAQFATAVLQPGDLVFRLHLVRIEAGDLVPQVLQVTHDDNSVSFSHLYVAP